MADADNIVPEKPDSYGGQMLGSLAVALLIVVGVISAVIARLGPTSIAKRRAQEEFEKERQEKAEEERPEHADEEGGRGDRRDRGTGRRASLPRAERD